MASLNETSNKLTVPTDEELKYLGCKCCGCFDAYITQQFIQVRDHTREATLEEVLTCVQSDYDVSHLIHWIIAKLRRAAEEARK